MPVLKLCARPSGVKACMGDGADGDGADAAKEGTGVWDCELGKAADATGSGPGDPIGTVPVPWSTIFGARSEAGDVVARASSDGMPVLGPSVTSAVAG